MDFTSKPIRQDMAVRQRKPRIDAMEVINCFLYICLLALFIWLIGGGWMYIPRLWN